LKPERPLPASPDIAAIARELRQAQDRAEQIEPFTGRLSGFDLRAAHAVSRKVSEARRAEGFVHIGRKIGFTNSSLWPVYGVQAPIWGDMYDRTVVRLDGGEGHCSLRAFAEPKIEPEIVFGLRTAPEPGADDAALLRSIEWVAHGFEIVQSHFPAWKFQAADTIADNGLHGALLLGRPQEVSGLGANPVECLRSFAVELSCGGEVRETGRGSNVLGSPLAALAHLVAALAREPGSEPLRPGEIVTTGTLTAAYPVRAGEIWKTEIRGIALPGLKVTFTG
jgi:2-keto-4-pentenoate hydratase